MKKILSVLLLLACMLTGCSSEPDSQIIEKSSHDEKIVIYEDDM